MGEKTGISWCDHTFNPWIGCTKVSDGCKNCYAERDNTRYGWVNGWGVDGERRRTSKENWMKPLAWNKAAKLLGVRRKVFCASLADVFEDRRELEPWRDDLFNLIEDTPDLDWLLLTKRPENILPMVDWTWATTSFPDNIWLGVTCENQEMADKRIPLLLNISATVLFVSVEPMLGEVNLADVYLKYGGFFKWVICGGESGAKTRSMNLDWARSLRDQCNNKCAFFFKQIGGNSRINGHWGGDLLDGSEYKEFPKEKK